MSLEIKILAGAESKAFLVDLEKLVKRMEAAAGGKVAAAVEDEEEYAEESDDDFAAGKKKAAKKKGASFEDEAEEEEEEEAEEEEEEEDEKPAKKTAGKKPPKFDLDDVNDACKDALERLGGTKKARAKIVKILQEDFDCEEGTVTELKSEQYGDAIAAVKKLK